MEKARAKINLEFKNHKVVQNDAEIPELLDVAKQVEHFYRTQVVQAVQVDDNRKSMFMRLKCRCKVNIFHIYFTGLVIREDTEKLDNKEFDENAKLPTRRGTKQCCNKKPE